MYCTLVITKKWDAVGHQESSFQAQCLCSSGRVTENPRPHVNMPSWSCTPPADNEPLDRIFETTLFKRCAICQRSFFGYRAHLTDEHTPGHPSRRRCPAVLNATPAAAPSPSPSVHFSSNLQDPDPPTAFGLSRTLFTGGL